METGGYMPAGFRAASGPKPHYAAMYGVSCTESDDYVPRTRLNVQLSDATVRFAWHWDSPGEKTTLQAIRTAKKPHLDVSITKMEDGSTHVFPSPRALREWLGAHRVKTLNVAGNSSPWIEPIVEAYLIAALESPVNSTV